MTIGMALKDERRTLLLSRGDLAKLSDAIKMDADKTYVLRKGIFPLENDEFFNELVKWIQKVCTSLLKTSDNYNSREIISLINTLARAILTILANVNIIDQKQVTRLKCSLKEILEPEQGNEDFAILLKYINLFDLTKLCRDLKSSKTQLSYEFQTVIIDSDPQKAEIEYEKCNQAYLAEQMTIARHINIKRAIIKLYRKSYAAKRRTALGSSSQGHRHLLAVFRKRDNLESKLDNVFGLLRKNSALLQPFDELNIFTKKVMFFFYYTKLDNPLDFHYIMSLLHTLAKIGSEYVEFVRMLAINGEFNQKSNKSFVAKKVEVSLLLKEFERWKNTKEEHEKDLAEKQRRRKVLGVKWEERRLKSLLNKKTNKAKK